MVIFRFVHKNGYTLVKRGRTIEGWFREENYGFGSPLAPEYITFIAPSIQDAKERVMEALQNASECFA